MPRATIEETISHFRTDAKAAWRKETQAFLMGKRKPENVFAMYLGGPESLDSLSWKQRGVPAENLIHVECDPKAFRYLRYKRHMKGVTAICDYIGNAANNLSSVWDGRINALSLDYCGFLTLEKMQETARVFTANATAKTFRAVVTYAKARDGDICKTAHEYFAGDRVSLLRHGLAHISGLDVIETARGEYRSSAMPMQWAGFTVSR